MTNRLIVVLLTLTVGIQGLILYRQKQTPPPPPTRTAVESIANRALEISVKDAPRLGSSKARVAIVEFADFQCPFCRRHATTVFPLLKEKFIDTGVAAYYYVHLPLNDIHPHAADAARAATCAGDQGQFWEVHDLLFAITDASSLAPDAIRKLAASLPIDLTVYDTCLGSSADRIAADVAQATRLDIKATPAFLLGTDSGNGTVELLTRINGAQAAEVFEKALGELRSAAPSE